MEDRKIREILEHRRRRDAIVAQNRIRQNEAFKPVEDQIEQEGKVIAPRTSLPQAGSSFCANGFPDLTTLSQALQTELALQPLCHACSCIVQTNHSWDTQRLHSSEPKRPDEHRATHQLFSSRSYISSVATVPPVSPHPNPHGARP